MAKNQSAFKDTLQKDKLKEMRYYWLYVVEYIDEATRTSKKGVHCSEMYDDLELCLSKLRYVDISREYPTLKKIRCKRVYSCTGKYFDLV